MDFKIAFINDHFQVKLSGKANVADGRKYLRQLTSHEKWRPGSLVLSDETELEVKSLSVDDIESIALICNDIRHALGLARIAAYVSSDLTYGMNRMLQAHAEREWDAQLRVFRTRSDAQEWLFNASFYKRSFSPNSLPN